MLLGGCAARDRQQREWDLPAHAERPADLAAAEGTQEVGIGFDSQKAAPPRACTACAMPQAGGAPRLPYLPARAGRARRAPRMRRLHALGFAVLGIDYRGFWRSEGSDRPSEALANEVAARGLGLAGLRGWRAAALRLRLSAGGAIVVDPGLARRRRRRSDGGRQLPLRSRNS